MPVLGVRIRRRRTTVPVPLPPEQRVVGGKMQMMEHVEDTLQVCFQPGRWHDVEIHEEKENPDDRRDD